MGKRKGFTLVEVTLFLAITALLFLGIAMGVQNSVFQQRYNDSTQSFLEFMRSVYSKVSNPQTTGKGDGGIEDTAIYGKLVVFGENTNLNGATITGTDEARSVFVYDVVGKADTVSGKLGSGSVLGMLKDLDVAVAIVTSRNPSDGAINAAELASPEKYTPHWGAAIEKTTSGTMFTGSILVVRHPRSGTINTLFYSDVIQVNSTFKDAKSSTDYSSIMNLLKDKIDSFGSDTVNFCINPDGLNMVTGTRRQNIRIAPNARNASDVELINLDDASLNACY
ncbi:prepilin-type N-terminal cleavage/methylation domain-containing protein [Candidatus Saccharibacteria bacterium]|nr:prepilin-type N-terminal cleavage/methylation domain-containing protein [Candidatus Saccharibacteria bacterium]